MNKPRFFSVLIVFLSILLLVNPGFTAENKAARELGERELSKYLVKCGDSWYIKRITAGPVELRKEGSINLKEMINLREMALSESDKLNGLEFKGVLVFSYYGPSRQFNSWDSNTWGKWKESTYFIDIIITKQNGQWFVSKSRDLFRGATYVRINCNNLPREESKPVKEIAPIEPKLIMGVAPIELQNVKTFWIDMPRKTSPPSFTIFPAIFFQVKNISQNTINSLSFEARFKLKNNSKSFGYCNRDSTESLLVGANAKYAFFLKSNYGFESKTKESFYDNTAWKTVLVELFLKKDKFFIPLGEFEIARRTEDF